MSPGRALAPLMIAALALIAPAADRADGAVAGPEVRTLANGLRVAFFPDAELPIVEIVLLAPAGTAVADAQAARLARPMAELLAHGTTSRSARAFEAAVMGVGGDFSSQATREHAVIAATFLAREFDAGIELVSDAVLRPAFLPSEVERIRRHAAASASRLERTAAAQAERRLWAEAFPDHPYGNSAFPAAADLQQLPADDLRAFHARTFDPARSMLAIGGDVTAERAFAAAERWFGAWVGGAAPAPAHPTPVPDAARPRIVVVDRPGSDRTELRLGFRLPARGDADEPAATLAATVLGEGPEPRLEALDGSGAFAGGVRFNRVVLGSAGLVSIGGDVRADSAAWAVERLRQSVADLAGGAVGTAELETAQRLERYQFLVATGTLRGRLTRWCDVALQELPAGYDADRLSALGRIRPEDVASAARRWLDPARAVCVAVGPAEALIAALSDLGEVVAVTADGAPLPSRLLPGTIAPAPEALARGRELVRQALLAHGGPEKLGGILDSAVEADVLLYVSGQEVPGRVRQVRKEPYRMELTTWFAGVEARQTLAGDRGWGIDPTGDRPAFDLDPGQVAALREAYAADLPHLLLDLAADGVEVVSLGRERIDDRDLDAIAARTPAGEQWIAYLETGSHRLAGIERREIHSSGTSVNRRWFDDYAPVDGIAWPRLETRHRGEQLLMRMKFESVTLNQGLDDSRFEKPAAPEPLPRR